MTARILTIPLAEYLADPALEPSLTRSLITTLLNKSAQMAWFEHPRLNPNPPPDDANRATDIGSAAHALLLEGGGAFEVIDATDYRTKAAQQARDAAREAGKLPILSGAYLAVEQMVGVAKGTLLRAGIDIRTGTPEQSIIWQSGCWLRTRPDWLGGDRKVVVEYKTTTLTPREWMRGLSSKGYDVQAVMHAAGVNEAYGEQPNVIFAVQNVEPPFPMFLCSLSMLYEELAKRKIARAVDIWSKCLAAQNWPGYPLDVQVIDPLPWQLAAEEERELEHEGWTPEAFMFGKVKE